MSKPQVRKGLLKFINETDLDLSENIRFFLYSRNDIDNSEQLMLNNETLINDSNYEVKKPTIFVVHGWQGFYTTNSSQTVKNGKFFIFTLSKNFTILWP